MVGLPFDILDIIARLLQQNTTTLKAACLVAHQWRLAFQPILFSDVQITSKSSSQHFLTAIRDRPLCGPYVNSLDVQSIGDSTGQVLAKLPRLEKLTLRRHLTYIPQPGFYNSLRLSLESRLLTSLTLHNFTRFPLQILNRASALRHLSSSNPSYGGMNLALAQHSNPQLDNHPTGPQLHSLKLSLLVSGGCDLFKWFTNPRCILDFRNLKILDVCPTDVKEFHMFCDLASVVPPTLEQLVFTPPPHCATPGTRQGILNSFSLTKFTHIRRLTLFIYLTRNRGFFEFDYLPWLIAFLSTLPNPSILESLTLQCIIASNISIQLDFRPQRWNELDALLTSTAFAHLYRVSLYLPHEPMFQEVRIVLTQSLPSLEREGKLLISPSPDLLSV
ncbi:hypothetical protein BDN72DRAFT_896692 [Pluteus cervinus]|uniref:Uncharacterized protein n=1 Tax=Pluteus cervinus TaxID=181527 RepID=A0ACD3AWI0_9AGAR|nr:hypothetical protein BDN72DRAFT_896692 [Pluteus cervinus]